MTRFLHRLFRRISGGFRRWRRTFLVLGGLIAIGAVAWMPVTTRRGVDFIVTAERMPLYAKALDFLQRDRGYRRLADHISPGDSNHTRRALAIFEWTRRNIRGTPAGFPVVDDHILHIIIRGYGEDDQKADVFVTLATYAGLPAYFLLVGQRPHEVPIAFVRIDDRWRMFDVSNGIVFRNAGGELASVEELARDPSLVGAAAGSRFYRGRPYTSYFTRFRVPTPPDVLRAEMQMPMARLIYEAKRLAGRRGQEWQPHMDGPVGRVVQ